MSIVWRKTAEFHLKGNEPSVAGESLEELIKIDPENRQTLAQLVLAYAKFDLKKALASSRKLPRFNYDYGSVDVDALESSAFLGAKHATRTAAVTASHGKATPRQNKIVSPTAPKGSIPSEALSENSVVIKKKKKRKNRHKPKSFNPDVDPDPERWLPRRERIGYRKPKRDRRKGAEKFTGAQGTSGGGQGQSETLDYGSRAAAGAVPKTSPATHLEAPVGPRQQQRKPHQKKKPKNKNRF